MQNNDVLNHVRTGAKLKPSPPSIFVLATPYIYIGFIKLVFTITDKEHEYGATLTVKWLQICII